MGIRNAKREELARLACKTLDARFKTETQQGLNCSPFEAEAVLQVVREVCLQFLDGSSGMAPPGKIALVGVCSEEPAGKPVAACEKQTVCLTVHQGAEDDRRMQELHDVGTALTHKRIICWKRYAEGKTSDQIGRDIYHGMEAVDRYLGQFDRVRHCREQGMTGTWAGDPLAGAVSATSDPLLPQGASGHNNVTGEPATAGGAGR